MAIVMMTMMFIIIKRIQHKDNSLLLAYEDIEDLLTCFLPRRDVTYVVKNLNASIQSLPCGYTSFWKIKSEVM